MRWLLALAALASSALAASPAWPQFGSNNAHLGAATVLASQAGTLRWKTPLGGGIYSSPAIDGSGTLYITSWDFSIYAINAATGRERGDGRAGEMRGIAALAKAVGVDRVASSGQARVRVCAVYPIYMFEGVYVRERMPRALRDVRGSLCSGTVCVPSVSLCLCRACMCICA